MDQRERSTGGRILLEDYSPYVDPGRYDVRTVHDVVLAPDTLASASPDAVIVTAAGSGRYLGRSRTPAPSDKVLAALRGRSCRDVVFGSDQDRIEILLMTC